MAEQPNDTFDTEYPETAKLLEGYVPWSCTCGKGDESDPDGPINARANTPIRCTCGRITWSAAS